MNFRIAGPRRESVAYPKPHRNDHTHTMANTFGILAAVALLIGAFVAHKNKEFLKDTIDLTTKEEGNKAKLQGTFDTLLGDIKALQAEKTGFDTTREETQVKLDSQLKTNEAIEDEIASKKSEADAAMAKADEAADTLKELGDIKGLAAKMKGLQADVRDLDDEISLNSAQVDRLEGNKTSTAAVAKDLAEKISKRVGGSSYFKSTKVRSVFRQYAFVTLAGGDNIGVVKKSKLSVMRGGEEVAQLIVTGVEANTAAANIIPSSVKDDVTVSPGDTVVPASAEEAK